jgi:hypothetical protein
LPAIPAVLFFDGVVSCWRTYTEAELRSMIDGLVIDAVHGTAYVWEMGRAGALLSPLGISYLIGYPAPSHGATHGAHDIVS